MLRWIVDFFIRFTGEKIPQKKTFLIKIGNYFYTEKTRDLARDFFQVNSKI